MKTRKGMSWKESSRIAAQKRSQEKQIRIVKYNLNSSFCKNCQISLSYEKRKNKFCSHSCSAIFNNQGIIRNLKTGIYAKKSCICCGKITENKKYCNITCWSLYIKEQRRNRIKKDNFLMDCRKDKWYLIEIRGHSCEICYNSKWNKKDIPLDIHHKNGDSDNNRLDNLQLICPNCHRQTKNHGSKNKTNSKRKQYRRDRYYQGLSY